MGLDDLKLLDDGGEIPKSKEEVGSSIPGCEISSLLDINLALACQPSVSKKLSGPLIGYLALEM